MCLWILAEDRAKHKEVLKNILKQTNKETSEDKNRLQFCTDSVPAICKEQGKALELDL